ncbi:MAG: sigma-70 family RNA polymerase sigma factor [Thermoguttaceae bacterium]|jgi:RNA polymerase sigma-70 factor (ECF subfamily)|nr:sigma-70 family RNA polymerase sigma factor [Thermoguttaceae bacterium]
MAETAGDPDELVVRLRSGNGEALAALFSQHRDRLWRLVSFRMDRRLAGRVDPDDVLQEAYLAAAQRLPHYGADSKMTPFVWLRLIVMQTLTDVHRHHLGAQMRDAQREVPAHGRYQTQSTSASLAAILAGHLTSPSQVAARAEMVDQVERAIAAMDPLDQEVLALRHFEELSNSEVAEVLGIQQKAASIRYVRAIRRLKEVLSRLPGFSQE